MRFFFLCPDLQSVILLCFRMPPIPPVISPYCLLSPKTLCVVTASWRPSVLLSLQSLLGYLGAVSAAVWNCVYVNLHVNVSVGPPAC